MDARFRVQNYELEWKLASSELKTEADRKVADVIFQQTQLARPLAAPPGTPKDRVDILRKGLMATFKDPAMVADAKRVKVDFNPLTGEEATQIINDFYKTPPELVKKARAFTQPAQ